MKFTRSWDGSGKETGIFVNTSKVVDSFLHFRHSKEDFIYP